MGDVTWPGRPYEQLCRVRARAEEKSEGAIPLVVLHNAFIGAGRTDDHEKAVSVPGYSGVRAARGCRSLRLRDQRQPGRDRNPDGQGHGRAFDARRTRRRDAARARPGSLHQPELLLYEADGRTLVEEIPIQAAGYYGTYNVTLKPGVYVPGYAYMGSVRLLPAITIEAGKTTTLDVDIDTGIR